jgi:hypothetical protein
MPDETSPGNESFSFSKDLDGVFQKAHPEPVGVYI